MAAATASFGSPVNQTTTQTQNFAGFAQPAVNQIIGRAGELSQRPFEAYGGERVAGMSGLQGQALGGIGGLQPAGAFQYGPAGSMTNQGTIQQYMNPFTGVLQEREKLRAGQDAAAESAKATFSGGLGGYRDAVQKAIGADLSAMRSMDIDRQAFENAQKQFNTEQQSALNYGMAQDRSNQAAQQGAMDVYGAQLRAGALPRDIDQQNKDVAYQNWLTGKEYDWKNLGRYADTVRPFALTDSTTNLNYGKPSRTSQFLGAGLAAAGLNKLGAFDALKAGIGGLRPGGGGAAPDYSQGPAGGGLGAAYNSSYRSTYDNPGAYTGGDMSWMDSGGLDTVDYTPPDYMV